jgi:serine/threonine protein kinase
MKAPLTPGRGADDSLLNSVRAALVAHDAGMGENTAMAGAGREQLNPEHTGDRIGAYVLQDCLGEGGFGTVWRAAQEKPVRRTVALKILKPGMDTAEVVGRFEQERQALAMMDHPGIARVLDAGATPAGRSFFAMELVDGSPITTFCDEQKLSTRERLALMVDVSRAVQHAHQKGIIHRDLKPSNILVSRHDGRAVPKVIDFGIAKAICEERLTERSIRTQIGGIMGTPAYMSPEQLSGSGTTDTRTDIYSLGVVLYELLTGQTPIAADELRAAWLNAGMQRIWTTPPPRPSTQVKTLPAEKLRARAEARRLDPPAFVRSLRGDLDCIALKALEAEPDRRYETANAFGEDLLRFLGEQPIRARPPSRRYLLRQFVRRNRLVVAAAAAVMLSLVLGMIVSTMLLLRERKARAAATEEAEKSRQVAHFLNDTLAAAGVSKSLGRDATMMREVLDHTAERIGKELATRPQVEAELRTAIGRTYRDLDLYPQAAEHLKRALDLRRAEFAGHDDPVLAAAIVDYADALVMEGHFAEAIPVAREGIAVSERALGPEHPETGEALGVLGWALLKTGHPADGEESARRAMRLWERAPDDDRLSEAPKTLACILRNTKRGEEAEAIFRQELAALRRANGPEHPMIVTCLDNLGMQLVSNGKFEEAETVLNEALQQGRKFFGDHSPFEDHVLARLATIAARRGDVETELKLSRDGVDVARRAYNEGHPYRKEALNNLLMVLEKQTADFLERAWAARARPDEAGPLAKQARTRLAELDALGAAQSEVKVAGPWLECLHGFALIAAGDAGDGGAEAERQLTEAQHALAAFAKPSAEEKKHAASAAVFLARLKELRGS